MMDFVIGNSVVINPFVNVDPDYIPLDDDDDSMGYFFGYTQGKIVGIRYYNGLVNNKEMVSLVREPANPYDRNAVRVNNLIGQQVGHISRDMAKALAEVVDQGLATIEGLVPYGADNIYKITVEISFWGAMENKGRVSRIMAKYGFPIKTERPVKGKASKSSQQYEYYNPSSQAQRLTSSQLKNELDGLFEKLKDVDQTNEEEACPAIRSTLYPHQKQAVAWMRKKEEGDGLPPFWEEKKPTGKVASKTHGQVVYQNSLTNYMTVERPKTTKGGILADDMGLGKTLITISLILGNSWNNKPIHIGKGVGNVPSSIVEEAKVEETMVIDLTSDDMVKETEEKPAEIKATIAEQDQRPVNASTAVTEETPTLMKTAPAKIQDDGAAGDNVQTADSVENTSTRRSKRKTKRPAKYSEAPVLFDLEEDKPKKPKKKVTRKKKHEDTDYNPSQDMTEKNTEKINGAHIKKSPSKTMSDLPVQYFDREPVPSDQARTTLIVCPLSLISNWVGQVEEHVHSGAEVKILVFHGPTKKQVTGKMIAEQDIVITTYQTLAQEFKRSTSTLLFKTNWLRIVLDEGHIIRNLSSQQSQACIALKAERRWVLSGTPIQNSIDDLYSLVLFLGIDFNGESWWKRTIQRPLKNGDVTALKKVRCLLGMICMRRTKNQKVRGKPIISMPPKDVFVQYIDLDTKERGMYDKMNAASKKMMMRYIETTSQTNAANTLQTNQYADMLVYIMRLRQICCHPTLAKEAVEALMSGKMVSEKAKELATKLLCMIEAGSLDDCCICLDSITTPVISPCSHVFCKLCIAGVVATNGQNYLDPRCPLCRGLLRAEDLVEPPAENEDSNDENVDHSMQPSSKIHALMHELLKLDKEDPSVKSLVVSQFTEFLKIIEKHLIANDIPYVLYHGGMTRKARENAIWHLQCGKAKVMLMTLKAGGVGLNLTAASRVFMMEPSWNPASEDQCFDRVYRLGQTKPVKITKFICKGTVEEKMVDMQNRKRALAKASLQKRTDAERKQQTMADMWSLMDM